MSKSSDLPVFLANYGPSFARTAYLLTGDADRALDLAVGALATVGRRWPAVRSSQPVQAVLRELYRRYLSAKAPPMPEPGPGAYALASLPPHARAAIVARFHDGLPPQQAAAITGLWPAALDQETDQAGAYLRATRPDLFIASPPPTEGPEPPERSRPPREASAPSSPATSRPESAAEPPEPATQPSHETPRDQHGPAGSAPPPPGPAAGQEAQRDRSAPWAAPWDAPGAAPGVAAEAVPGAGIDASETGAVTRAETGSFAVAGNPGSTPWEAPARAWDVVPDADDPALRAVLVRIAAAEMPHIHLSGPVLRLIGRRRRIRAATWTTLTVGAMGAFVALTLVAVTAVARNIERVTAEPSGFTTAYPQPTEKIPEALPASLSDPISYAYVSYCGGTGNNPANPQPCGQWRLTTVSGDEWRLPGAGAGYDEDRGDTLPFALSQNGRRLAYRNNQGSYVVHDLPTGTIKRIDVDDSSSAAHLTSSPNGRYVAIDFADATNSALLDFDTGVTRYTSGAVRVLAVRNDGVQVVTETEDVDDVPGHASVTTIELTGAQVYAGGYRIDPDLIEYGTAVSPDGHTLALIAEDSTLVTMDVRTGRLSGRRTVLEDYEVIAVERWIGADEVLVRQWDEDDYIYLTKVNVRSGATTSYAEETAELLDYDSPLGVLGQ
ncbi:hypothetical protein [Nonomuraea basaltis]|uniref:hypothetical protein n=1 Tax=Nonomuraea basaltis TaxID=2495887 RepID=UPI00110C7062|nr:hypothetical protein [Nonomuraea basaltis]TMR96981.1 hypothetical protein EJK15_20615 [Nonomuraea basaltis]